MAQESRSLPFLEINTDARTAGMGDANMGETKGMFLYTNPSAFFNTENNLYTSYTFGMYPKLEEGTNMLHAVSAGYKFLDKHAVMVGFRYFGGLEIARVAANGVEMGKTTCMDMSIDLNYAFKFNENLSAFVGGSFIQSTLFSSASTGGFNAGINYNNVINENTKYMIGLDIRDFGGEIKYSNSKTASKLPGSIGIGGTMSFNLAENHVINAALTGRYYMMPSEASAFVAGIGAEYELFNVAALRVGYHIGNSNNYITAGIGFKVKFGSIDAAYSIASQKDFNLLRVGLNLNLF